MYNITFSQNSLYGQKNIKRQPSFGSVRNISNGISVPYTPQEYFSVYDNQCSLLDYLRNDILKISGASDLCEKSCTSSRLSEIVDNHHELPRFSQSGESFSLLLDKYRVFDIARAEKVDTIIDLNGFNSLKDACKMYGFNYISYPTAMGNYWENSIFQNHDELIAKEKKRLSTQGLTKSEFAAKIENFKTSLANEQRMFMDEFKKIVTALRRGHCYMGCTYGDIRTEGMLKLISNIDIDYWGTTKFPVTGIKEKELYRNFVKNLTKQDLEFFSINAEKLQIITKAFK